MTIPFMLVGCRRKIPVPTRTAEIGLDERRVALAAIATLVNLKRPLYELLLKPAGVPADVYWPLLRLRSPDSGRALSKRELAPLILAAIEQRPECTGVIPKLVEITAQWTAFHVAGSEFEARATVEMAREVVASLRMAQDRESEDRETRQQATLERMRLERMALIRRGSPALLRMLQDLISMPDPQARGHVLELLLTRVFELHEIPVFDRFQRNAGGEQIDGAFSFEGWHYLVEAKWQERLTDIRQMDSLYGKVARSGPQTLGMFLTMNGFSPHVVPLLQQNPEKRIFLMDGRDLLAVLDTPLDLCEVLRSKLVRLNINCEPWFPAYE